MEQQQEALLRVLRGARGAPVSFAELQEAGIEFPASVACELELAGASIEHCSLSVEQGTARRARVPALRLDPPVALAVPPSQAATGEPRRRIYVARPKLPLARAGRGARPGARVPALLLLGCAALAAILIAALGGGGKPAASAGRATGAGAHSATSGHAPAGRAPVPHRASAGRAPVVSVPARHAPARAPARSGASASRPSRPPVAVSPARAAELESRGHSLLEAGRYSQATPVLKDAVAATGESVAGCATPESQACLTYAYALYDLGRSLQLGGDPAAAVPILEGRLEIDNQRPVVQAALESARASARR